MSLSDLFSDKVSSRVAAYAFAAVSVLGLEGCVTTGSTYQNVIPTATRSGTLPLRQGMASGLSHGVKCALGTVNSCGQNNGGAPYRNDPRFGY